MINCGQITSQGSVWDLSDKGLLVITTRQTLSAQTPAVTIKHISAVRETLLNCVGSVDKINTVSWRNDKNDSNSYQVDYSIFLITGWTKSLQILLIL